VGADSVRRAMCSSRCTMYFGIKAAFPEAARKSNQEEASCEVASLAVRLQSFVSLLDVA